MVICNLAGIILSGAKIAPMVKSMVPSIILLVVKIALLVMMKLVKSFSLIVKNTPTSLLVQGGYVMI